MDRIVAWYRVGSSVGAVVALIVANVIPLVGVLFLGWSVWNILVIYWIENGIVGGFNVLKMALADGTDMTMERGLPRASAFRLVVNGHPMSGLLKVTLIPFFMLHYGMFWLVHGVFVFVLPQFAGMSGTGLGEPMTLSFGSIAFAAVALAISHGVSFWWNFVRGGEYRRTTPVGLMFAPYGRLVALHLTIIFGAFAIMLTGAPVAAVAVLVLIKIAIDLGLHLREHRPTASPVILAD